MSDEATPAEAAPTPDLADPAAVEKTQVSAGAPSHRYLVLDAAGFVLSAVSSNMVADGAVEVTDAAYLQALAKIGRCAFVDGAVVDRAPTAAPVSVPMAVSKLGLVRALREKGDWAKVKAALAQSVDLQDDWDAAQQISRSDVLTQAMIATMGYSEADVDALMLQAIQLP